MKENTFILKAGDDKEIFCYEWLPDNQPPEYILQIIHGMSEHSERYRETAKFFTEKNFAVYSMDLRGHGKTAGKVSELGFFAEKDGWKKVLEDIYNLSKKIKEKYPEKHLFILGHSMGSLFARAYMAKYPDMPKGVLLSGTTGEKGFLIKLGKNIALAQGIFKSPRAKSKLLLGMSFKGYNDRFKPTKTPYDWLSRDEEIVMKYYKDPFCGGIPSNRFYYDMLSLIDYINQKDVKNKIPKDLPILMFAGTDDPVGDYGKGVKKVYQDYKNSGMNVEIKLYEGGRHEMLNEINRQEVLTDIYNWIKRFVKDE